MMAVRLKAGVIGLGVMGRNHARVLASLDHVEFVGAFDPGITGDVHGRPVCADLDELLENGLDYAVVAAPTALHLELASLLAERGIHALIEKPVAATADDARQLRDLFAARRLIGGVGHIERYNPALQQARRDIEEGLIGEIYQISTRRQGPFPGRISDVGVIKDLATHDIDLTAWVTQQEYVSVNARTTYRSGRPHEDMVVAVGTLSRGTIASHTVNWLTPFKERTTTIIGEKGALVADTLTTDLTLFRNGTVPNGWERASAFRGVSEGDATRFALTRTEPLRAEHVAFRDAVLTRDTAGIVTLNEGTRVVETAERLVAEGLRYRAV